DVGDAAIAPGAVAGIGQRLIVEVESDHRGIAGISGRDLLPIGQERRLRYGAGISAVVGPVRTRSAVIPEPVRLLGLTIVGAGLSLVVVVVEDLLESVPIGRCDDGVDSGQVIVVVGIVQAGVIPAQGYGVESGRANGLEIRVQPVQWAGLVHDR